METRLVRLALAGMLVWSVTACDLGQSVSDVEYVYRAREQLEQGKFRAAVIELKNALSVNPDNADARLMLGELHLDTGDGASAEKELRHAQQLGVPLEALQVPLARAWFLQRKFDEVDGVQAAPGLGDLRQAELLAIQGEALVQRGQVEAAEARFSRARELSQVLAAPLVGQALVATTRGDFARAEQLLGEALRLEENHTAAWSLRGDLAFYQGRLEEAVDHYGQALASRRDQMGNLGKRAVLLVQLQRLDQARQDIAAMRGLIARHPAIDYAMGMLELQEQRYDNARLHFENVLGMADNYRDTILQLGLANLGAGNAQQAELYLARAFARNPRYIPGRILLAMARLKQGEAASAVQLLEPVVAQKPDNLQARSLLASGLIQLGRADEAMEHYRKLAQANPEVPQVQAQLGMGLLAQGDYEGGVHQFEQALARFPELQQTDMLLVMTHLHQGDFAQALVAAGDFARRQPQDPMPRVLEGMARLGLGDREAARAAFLAADRLQPGNPAANHRLAMLDMEQEDFAAARRHYGRTLEFHPDHSYTLNNLAVLEARAGNEKAMVDVLTRAIDAHPDEIDFHLQLSRHYLGKQQPDQALALLLPLRDRHSRHPPYLAMLGTIYMAQQDWSNARSEFSTLVDVAPEWGQGHYSLALLCRQTRDEACVRQQLARTLQVEPGHVEARLDWGHVLVREGRFPEAEELLSSLQEDVGDHPRIQRLEGALALALNQPGRAVQVYSQAMQQAPSNILAIELAKAQWLAGEQEAARALLEARAREYPDDINLLLARAQYAMRSQQDQEARERYRRVIELEPGHVLARNNLAHLLLETAPAEAAAHATRALQEAPGNPVVTATLLQALLAQGKDTEARTLVDDTLRRGRQGPDGRYLEALWLQRQGQLAPARQVLVNLLAEHRDFALEEQARALLRDLNR